MQSFRNAAVAQLRDGEWTGQIGLELFANQGRLAGYNLTGTGKFRV